MIVNNNNNNNNNDNNNNNNNVSCLIAQAQCLTNWGGHAPRLRTYSTGLITEVPTAIDLMGTLDNCW